jgi:hypothetical protein
MEPGITENSLQTRDLSPWAASTAGPGIHADYREFGHPMGTRCEPRERRKRTRQRRDDWLRSGAGGRGQAPCVAAAGARGEARRGRSARQQRVVEECGDAPLVLRGRLADGGRVAYLNLGEVREEDIPPEAKDRLMSAFRDWRGA